MIHPNAETDFFCIKNKKTSEVFYFIDPDTIYKGLGVLFYKFKSAEYFFKYSHFLNKFSDKKLEYMVPNMSLTEMEKWWGYLQEGFEIIDKMILKDESITSGTSEIIDNFFGKDLIPLDFDYGYYCVKPEYTDAIIGDYLILSGWPNGSDFFDIGENDNYSDFRVVVFSFYLDIERYINKIKSFMESKEGYEYGLKIRGKDEFDRMYPPQFF